MPSIASSGAAAAAAASAAAGSATKQRTEGLSSGVNRRSTSFVRASGSSENGDQSPSTRRSVIAMRSFPPARRTTGGSDDPGASASAHRNSTAIVSARIFTLVQWQV